MQLCFERLLIVYSNTKNLGIYIRGSATSKLESLTRADSTRFDNFSSVMLRAKEVNRDKPRRTLP